MAFDYNLVAIWVEVFCDDEWWSMPMDMSGAALFSRFDAGESLDSWYRSEEGTGDTKDLQSPTTGADLLDAGTLSTA